MTAHRVGAPTRTANAPAAPAGGPVPGPAGRGRSRPPDVLSLPHPMAVSGDAPSGGRRVYLDYAATTPADPGVIAAMTECLGREGVFGNPASRTHALGREASERVEAARESVASLIEAEPSEVVWTSGATESTNLAVKGMALGGTASRAGERRGHIVTSALEHKATLDCCDWLEGRGFEVTRLRPDSGGAITAQAVEAALREDTVLVSLMAVNNEVGTITDLEAVGAVTRARGIVLHADLAQAAARLPVSVDRLRVDMASLSGHKMYGPKGVGVLYVRRSLRDRIEPQIHGGGQEMGLRAGTLPTHQIVGMGAAAELVRRGLGEDRERVAALERRLFDSLGGMDGFFHNGDGADRVPGIVSVGFEGVASESLLVALPDLALSTGSACTSRRVEPSHVLASLGVPEDRARCSVRVSLGRYTTEAEVEYAAGRLVACVTGLRALASVAPAAPRYLAEEPAALPVGVSA